MHGHALADATSLALHREVAVRLRERPDLLDAARARIAGWDGLHPWYRERWSALLAAGVEAVCRLLEEDSEHARDMRQATPFAGVLDNATRWRIWREVRGRRTPSRQTSAVSPKKSAC